MWRILNKCSRMTHLIQRTIYPLLDLQRLRQGAEQLFHNVRLNFGPQPSPTVLTQKGQVKDGKVEASPKKASSQKEVSTDFCTNFRASLQQPYVLANIMLTTSWVPSASDPDTDLSDSASFF
ncbi:hypothetical protein PoB_003430200 [Plakobranchus ocellatus]|uniref:Uncharacterized protein n=1 Tax=Plakobranchus ocellatus TaxID=259542 RepID=A0AAV4ALK7_9GAST|nr:hypothetical protein PoB_003430200 [Plakobranchus ocellatus]